MGEPQWSSTLQVMYMQGPSAKPPLEIKPLGLNGHVKGEIVPLRDVVH
eukprot:CAMPEP_0204489860 /NCGR_PEP_ID=MMETSP0471-20130131/73294_1 /ASSEMBLY_ACC=CAM_ASM_000602 /TAXON_ID=2969 /ORGANISM="Oxyrrhis marina" /LENGTH=47 /DNA_ID= /DNA_START= /DNA_END= /DNA_ORIENTATION=